MTSSIDVYCAAGMPRVISPSATRGNEDGAIGEDGTGRDARGMLRADNGIAASRGGDKAEGEGAVTPTNVSFCARGLSADGEKRRLGSLAVSAREGAGGKAEAAERLRPFFFSADCHLWTAPLELARLARDTALRPMFPNPNRGLTPPDLLPALRLAWAERRGDGRGDGRDFDGDSSSSVSSALPSNPGDNCPRVVKRLRVRLRGEIEGDCA